MRNVISGEYKYLVAIVGTKKETGKLVKGGYELFKELDEPALRNYATSSATENDIILTHVEVYSLETKLCQGFKP